MDTASQILIVSGMTLLFFGFLMGIPMVAARSKASHPPRYLFAAHLVPMIQGGMLLALTIAVDFARLPDWVVIAVAGSLAGGMGLFTLGLVCNWLQGIQDAFAENAIGGKVSALGTPLVIGGGGVLLFGVVLALIR